MKAFPETFQCLEDGPPVPDGCSGRQAHPAGVAKGSLASQVRALRVSMQIHALQAFVMLVLLCSWLTVAQLDRKSYDVVEAFAGHAEFSRACRVCNIRAAAADLSYDVHAFRKGGMDLTTPSGFVSLASTQCSNTLCRRSFDADAPTRLVLRIASTAEAVGSSCATATL